MALGYLFHSNIDKCNDDLNGHHGPNTAMFPVFCFVMILSLHDKYVLLNELMERLLKYTEPLTVQANGSFVTKHSRDGKG
jgi:hypothetical protein